MRRTFRFLLPLLLVGAGVALFIQLKSSGPQDAPTVVTERRWPVEAVRVQFRELRPTVRLYGRVESPTESRIRSALSTDIRSSFALVGQAVSQGDVLLQLDDVDAKLALAQRQAELAEIKARIESENSRYRNDIAALTPIREQFPDVTLHSSSPNAPEGQRNQPGQVVELGGLQITSRETPGHADDGVTYVVDNFPGFAPKVAMVGDAIFAGSMGGAPSHYQLAREKVQSEILSLSAETILCPGHGPITTVAEQLTVNPFF